MDLLRLRYRLRKGDLRVRIATHARVEAIKDGLTESDLRHTLERGEEIEDYADRARALLLGWTEDKLPCHVILEWEEGDSQVVIVSAYIPERAVWFPDWRRRRKR